MKQQEIRELAFQFLYQIQIQREAVTDQLDSFLKREQERLGEGMEPANAAKLRQLVEGVLRNQDRIDQEIRNHLVGWTLERTAPVDLAILRLALYEIIEEAAPFSVICHEAVLLANKFSIERSRKFINGLLAQYDPERQLSKTESTETDPALEIGAGLEGSECTKVGEETITPVTTFDVTAAEAIVDEAKEGEETGL